MSGHALKTHPKVSTISIDIASFDSAFSTFGQTIQGEWQPSSGSPGIDSRSILSQEFMRDNR
jgi:hypothetical protein